MKRKPTKTRAELIALLKSRGIKGRLSKMTKAQLLAKVEKTTPPTTQTPEKEVAQPHNMRVSTRSWVQSLPPDITRGPAGMAKSLGRTQPGPPGIGSGRENERPKSVENEEW